MRYLQKVLFVAAVLALLSPAPASADTIKFKDGTQVEGVIRKVEAGRVFALVNEEEKIFEILQVESMDFNTPHLPAASSAANLPLEHFLKDIDAQEMVRNIEMLEKTSDDIRKLISRISANWRSRQPIERKDLREWESAKETFRRPLSRYQELLNDLYFHVLAKVDEYSALTKEANDVYVGVKGIFNVGSPLVSKEMEKLPLKKYVPGNWYDTIFYDGYNRGYDDAYVKFAGQGKVSQ
jgi:hypothetical protein